MSGADLNTLHRTTHLVLTTSLGVDVHFTLHFNGGPETEVQFTELASGGDGTLSAGLTSSASTLWTLE